MAFSKDCMAPGFGNQQNSRVTLTADYRPEFDSLRNLLLEIASERSLANLLRRVVQHLAGRPHAVRACLWLVEKGDLCASCSMRSKCSDQTRCLHLVAGAQSAEVNAEQLESSPKSKGQLLRIPLGVGVLGRIANSGESVVSNDPAEELREMGGLGWIAADDIQAFDGQPIIFQNQVLGALVQYVRIPIPDESPVWLRIFANHIGVAIANARSFEEIERLKGQLEVENAFLREEVREANAFGEMVGESNVLKQLLRQVEMVSRTDATVLVLGESGTGKELVAREIHRLGSRSARPLIRVNCASIPKELYESEFFGHVKGAFTGALRDRIGRFEAAHGGTLFLDEVGEIPLELQSKFLRVLQEGQYERVGEEKTRTVDVRIIAATNRNLPSDVEAGRFRQDLYYRLNVFPIEVAPLRERKEDILLLAEHFLGKAAHKLKLPVSQLTPAHLAQFQAYDWPGNIRELQNVIERGLILAQQGTLGFNFSGNRKPQIPFVPALDFIGNKTEPEILSEREFRHKERDNILAALKKANWKVHGNGGAAELLGIKPTTLISRMKKFGLAKPD